MIAHWTYEQLCAAYIKHLYQSDPNDNATIITQNFEHSSGEVLPESLSKILTFVKLQPHDRFLDLGSGTGKLVTQVFLQTEVKTVMGIEIVPAWVATAKLKAAVMLAEFPIFKHKQIHFELGNFLQIAWNQPTIIFMNNICFKQSTLRDLEQRILQLTSVHTIISLRPLALFDRWQLKKVISIEGSWDSALCYIYGKCED